MTASDSNNASPMDHGNPAPDPAGGLAALIRQAHLGEPAVYESLAIYPLFTPDGHRPAYDLLEDALAAETAVISEATEGGSVPELVVENRGEKPVLILEGDVLIGAKQNRVVNLTILVPAHARFPLPVSCVERGRWRYTSRHFAVRRSAPPDLRRAKVRSVMANMQRTGLPVSDQLEVWDKVAECLDSVAASSSTDSLEDGYAASEPRLAAFREKLRLPEGATGFLVMIGGRVAGLDLFGEMATAARCWVRLSESYFLEALRRPPRTRGTDGDAAHEADAAAVAPSDATTPTGAESQRRTAGADRRRAEAFLTRVARHARLHEGAAGLGREIVLDAPRLAGLAPMESG
ncbi:MAG: hypothetical protein M1457_03830 [bacterium]|nr:hypothetical protein [bacterium]